MNNREFDEYSENYEALLRDPLRDRFSQGSGNLFFHLRKRDVIQRFWKDRHIDTHFLKYLDLGCGKGELLTLLAPSFQQVAGCDCSIGMIESIKRIETRVQSDPCTIPFENERFDFVTAVCVYHHVPVEERARLTSEAKRVLRPGGVFCIIEHNPYNPVTRAIVRRTPVDANAILLPSSETRRLLLGLGFSILRMQYFLFLPAIFYGSIADNVEAGLGRIPQGGQYAVFAQS